MSRANGRASKVYSGVTCPGAVETADGWMPYLTIVTGSGPIEAPVRVVTDLRDHAGRPMPERDGKGRLVYALPGGGRFSP